MARFFELPEEDAPIMAAPHANYVHPALGGELLADGEQVITVRPVSDNVRDALRMHAGTRILTNSVTTESVGESMSQPKTEL